MVSPCAASNLCSSDKMDEMKFLEPSFFEESMAESTRKGGSEESDADVIRIAHRENKAVNRSRAAVMLVLLVCGSVLGTISYFVGRKAEKDACKSNVSH
jgi:hypothetical protein